MKKILCVCLGNICRSPAAEGIFRAKIAERLGPGSSPGRRPSNESFHSSDWLVDSCGTGDWHIGERPDKRSVQVCEKHGIDIFQLKARQLTVQDGEDFDLILGMDYSNLENIKKVINPEHHHKIHLIDGHEVNDPYYSAFDGFEIMYQQLEQAVERWIEKLCDDL